MKGTKTIAEYAIKRWMEKEGLDMNWFRLEMNGREATLTDKAGDKMKLYYDGETKEVSVL